MLVLQIFFTLWTFNFASIILKSMAKNENKKNQTGFWLACWILAFLILLIMFLVKQDEIFTTLKTTRCFERLFGKTPSFIENHEIKEKENVKEPENDVIILNVQPKTAPVLQKEEKQVEETVKTEPSKEEKTEVAQTEDKKTAKTEILQSEDKKTLSNEVKDVVENKIEKKEEKKVEKPEVKTVKTSVQKLYFVFIGEDGTLSRKMITRTVEKNDSPLVTNINLLLAGPNQSESNKGYRNLIPAGTKLLSASVRDGIAYLNFNEQFEFNTVGMDGYQAQLMQIVFTATEFSTVDSVQFLIEGQKKDYLGSEGVWIGSPLSRGSFS